MGLQKWDWGGAVLKRVSFWNIKYSQKRAKIKDSQEGKDKMLFLV